MGESSNVIDLAPQTVTNHPAPVFVLAPARSFSTVVLALLAGHPDLFGFPELLVFTSPTVAGFLDERLRATELPMDWTWSRRSGVLRAVAEVHESTQSRAALLRAEQWLEDRRTWPMTALFDHLLGEVAPRIGLEKSPDTVASDDALDKCLEAYPEARFLHLTRHPVTTQRSMQQHWREAYNLHGARLYASCASAWYLAHRRILDRMRQLPDSQHLRVRGEDLLREPHVWIPVILEWLALPCTDAIVESMQRTEGWRFAGTGEAQSLFGGDPKFMRSPKLRPPDDAGPVTFEPEWGLPAEMCSRMSSLAATLGYQ